MYLLDMLFAATVIALFSPLCLDKKIKHAGSISFMQNAILYFGIKGEDKALCWDMNMNMNSEKKQDLLIDLNFLKHLKENER